MKEITVEEFQENFDEILDSIEEGEYYLIVTDQGNGVVAMPYDDYAKYYEGYFTHDQAS